uniref:Proteasomal ATPase associated factor 1 n=1 Tax=Ornithorhynchus anatinus TaxID=9258 RepID=A0A6I8NTM3_ORNAN
MAAAVRIQSDWAQVLRRNEAEVWLSCHSPGKPTLYGTLTCQGLGPDGVPEVTASEGFVVSEVTGKSIRISCPKENASSRFLAPQATFPRIHTQSVTCLDVSCGGGLGVSASTDGTMKIWQAANGEIRRVLEGHVFDVNCCRFFPSGLVVLSGGMDAQLKVWSVEDAKCAVTFKGHKGGEREVGTEAKLLLLAREDRKLQAVGLQSRQPVFLFEGSDAFNCCAFLSSIYVLAGTQDGKVYQLDVRNSGTPVQVVRRSGAPVHSLLPYRDGFVTSHGDGSCFLTRQDLDHVVELTGVDCDPVYQVAAWEKQMYTCCRDGLVRRYRLSDL